MSHKTIDHYHHESTLERIRGKYFAVPLSNLQETRFIYQIPEKAQFTDMPEPSVNVSAHTPHSLEEFTQNLEFSSMGKHRELTEPEFREIREAFATQFRKKHPQRYMGPPPARTRR